MKVKECMCSEVVWANPNSTVSEVAKQMLNNHIGCIPVCDNNNNVVGLVTDRDLILRCIASDKDCKQTKINEIMTTNIKTVTPENDVKDASKIMCECQIKRVPVVENNKIVGIITLGDLAQENQISNNEVGNTVEEICKCGQNEQNNQ